jgi:DNA-binding transcriptional LysR family regulator
VQPLTTFDLRIFAAIADAGSLTAAARRLGLQKSLISRDLARLEDRVGLRLVERTTRHLRMTEAGETLARHARRVAEEAEMAEAALAQLSDQPRGDLTLSAPPAFVRFVLTPALGQFRRDYPDIRLLIDATVRVVDLIGEGVDVAIRVGPLPDAGLIAHRLGASRLILVAAAEYLDRRGTPADTADLDRHDLIGMGPGLPLPGAAGARPVITCGDPGLVLDMVTAGLGIGPVPAPYAAEGLRSGALCQVLPDAILPAPAIHALFPSRRAMAPKIRTFIDFTARLMDPTRRT